MDEVIELMQALIVAELAAENAHRTEGDDSFDDKYAKYVSYMADGFRITGLVAKPMKPDKRKYETWARFPAKTRSLYKVERFDDADHGTFYLAYTDGRTPPFEGDSIGFMYFVSDGADGLKVRDSSIYSDHEVDIAVWQPSELCGIPMDRMTAPAEVVRVLEPTTQKFIYLADGVRPDDISSD